MSKQVKVKKFDEFHGDYGWLLVSNYSCFFVFFSLSPTASTCTWSCKDWGTNRHSTSLWLALLHIPPWTEILCEQHHQWCETRPSAWHTDGWDHNHYWAYCLIFWWAILNRFQQLVQPQRMFFINSILSISISTSTFLSIYLSDKYIFQQN